MIGAVIAFRLLAQALRAALRLSPPRGRSLLVVRLVTLLVVAGLVVGLVQGDDVAAQSPVPTSPTPSVRPTQPSARIAQVGGFVSGTVWEDTKIRNGQLDDNEPGLAGVTIVVERVDVPSGPL